MTGMDGTPKPPRLAVIPGGHEILPLAGTVFSMMGPNTGLEANLLNPHHFPAEALCHSCKTVIYRETMLYGEWVHTGRRPGDPR